MRKYRIIYNSGWYYVQRRNLLFWFIPIWIAEEEGGGEWATTVRRESLQAAEAYIEKEIEYRRSKGVIKNIEG